MCGKQNSPSVGNCSWQAQLCSSQAQACAFLPAPTCQQVYHAIQKLREPPRRLQLMRHGRPCRACCTAHGRGHRRHGSLG